MKDDRETGKMGGNMRRKDREVTDIKYIDAIIQSCDCCRIGLVDQGQAYLVPLSFGYVRDEEDDKKGHFFFHGASQGRKLDIIRQNPNAGFELDTNYMLKEGETACGYSCCYQSVIGSGRIYILHEAEEKIKGLNHIMQHYSKKTDWEYDTRMIEAVTVLRMDVEELSCKEHSPIV